MKNEAKILESDVEELSIFEQLYAIDISPFLQTMTIGGRELEYLEWATAWRLAKQFDPNAFFHIRWANPTEPYFKTELGYFVCVEVTIRERVEFDIYAIDTKEMPTASDITNAHQRCLVKCLGRHGLGLKLWEKKEREKLKVDLSRGAPTLSSHQGPSSLQRKSVLPSSSEYRMGIPKNRSLGKTLDEMGVKSVQDDFQYWANRISNEGKPAGGEVKKFLDHAEAWLKAVQVSQGKTFDQPPPFEDGDIPF